MTIKKKERVSAEGIFGPVGQSKVDRQSGVPLQSGDCDGPRNHAGRGYAKLMTRLTLIYASRRQITVLAALAAASALCFAVVAARIYFGGTWRYVFLLWNLFLAWIPLVTALAVVWLLFFPNAPYMVTDLLHLSAVDNVPLWYDTLLLATFAWTSFLLGFVSLYLMQTMVSRAAGAIAGWVFATGVLALSAFGVYLGRFQRWNSWDVLYRPVGLLADIADRLRHPLSHPRTLVFTGLLAVFLITTYFVLVAFAHLPQETHGTVRN